jgi:pimeloyl-ACP methyl ester carboxylesterase/threonine/homoserine/homoserine lactone efflux protein
MTYLISGLVLGLSAGLAPGPLLTLVVSETMRYGTKEGIKVALAPLVSDLPIVLGTVFVLSRLSNVHVFIGAISFVGAAFLTYLGYESVTFKGVDLETIREKPRSLKKAVVTNILNPHPYIFWLSIGAPLILKALRIHVSNVVLFVAPFYILLVGSKLIVAVVTGKSRRFLKAKGYIYTMKALGLALLLFAVLFLVEGFRTLGVLKMEPSSGFAEVNGTKLYYEMMGNGPPLVLIHGGLMDRRMWDDQFEVFAKEYKVLRYDIRGYEKSEMPEGPFSHVDDLYGLMRFLNIDNASIVGLSLGGMIAIDLTLEHPDMVNALISVAAGLNGYHYADTENLAEKYQRIFKTGEEQGIDAAVDLLMELPFFIPVDENSKMRRRMREMAKENYVTWSGPQDIQVWPQPPSIERLSDIEVPTLVIVGDHDVTDIFGVADSLEEKIPGAKKIIIQGAGHHVNMEKPETFNQVMLDFLRSINQ